MVNRQSRSIFTLTRDDVIRCAREMGMPADVITEDILTQVKQYLSTGTSCYWDEFIKHAINFALKS